MWGRWRHELKREGQLRERERVVRWRKALIKKRQVIVHWYLQIAKEKEQGKRLQRFKIRQRGRTT
jgi:hypothetical protein